MTEQVETPDPRTFNVLDFIAGRNFPKDMTTVFTDTNSAYEARRIVSRLTADMSQDAVDALEKEREEALARVRASALTFEMQGMPQEIIDGIIEKIDKKYEEKPDPVQAGRDKIHELMAAHIVSVTDANGNRDARVWTADEVEELLRKLPTEAEQRVIELMHDISFNAQLFQSLGENADF